MKKQRKIKNYLLFPHIQLKFLLLRLLTVVFTVGFFLYQLHASFALLMGIGQKMGLGPDSAYFRLLKAQETLIVDETLWGLLISIILILAINFVITHRTLGPFYRLKVFFKKLHQR